MKNPLLCFQRLTTHSRKHALGLGPRSLGTLCSWVCAPDRAEWEWTRLYTPCASAGNEIVSFLFPRKCFDSSRSNGIIDSTGFFHREAAGVTSALPKRNSSPSRLQ